MLSFNDDSQLNMKLKNLREILPSLWQFQEST